MSLLYPLYALAALGILAPIVFHLFQRKPKGQREFSSLLFLRPTPPRVTSRSRLSDLLLLLCRALILGLLAVAFARPFVRSVAFLELAAPSRAVVVLVDTSASMRREGVWQRTQDKIREIVADLRAEDQVALVSFDRAPQTQISFEAWSNFAASGRLEWLREQAATLKPSWHRTDLASALTLASDLLLQQADDGETQVGKSLQIVLCSDIQEGADLSGLQAYRWPSEVDLQIVSIEAPNRSNASLQWLPVAEDEQDDERIRVLVRNESDSQTAELTLDWQDEASTQLATHVPPGQTRVVRLKQPSGSYQLMLRGDDQPFDNQAFFPMIEPAEQEVWLVGSKNTANDNRQSLLYFLERSPLNTRRRKVQVQVVEQQAAVATAVPDAVPLVIVADPSLVIAEDLRRYLTASGRVLLVVPPDESLHPAAASLIANLFESEEVHIRNLGGEDAYAMLSNVDFQNSLLQPFSDPRFNDFSKIRFWAHREVTSASAKDWNVVIRFDDGSPTLAEKQVGQGTLWFLTSGWQPSESELALSTKFVPLLHGFFADNRDLDTETRSYVVGDSIPIRALDVATTVLDPDGGTHTLDPKSNRFVETDVPGMYTIEQPGRSYQVAVNLAKEESRTDPLLPGRLEQLGVSLGNQQTVILTEAEQRQLRNEELEGRQKFWRWGVLGALGLMVGETWLSRRRSNVHSYGDVA